MTIELSIHNVTRVKTELNLYDTFNVTRVEIAQANGELMVINLFKQGNDDIIQVDEPSKDYRRE